MTHTLSRLLTQNQLEQSDEGLWIVPGTGQQSFAYSDGDDAENYVYDVIANASDTSSASTELESHIRDWPSEYHFTSKRATLLRALDLSSMDQVLELGCGCGAISRYLGEQGMQVDAIEGSTRRAQIARSRCRDLGNVNIVNANYNDLSLPEGEYDAIFLIGVLEYAKRFCPDAADDFAAVHEILTAIGKSLKTDGVMITAIENRLGLKYLLGATEDHYAVPYIGLHGYPDSAGIRTFDHKEWLAILDRAGFPEREFYAPFPDYKIPSVVLHEGFLKEAQATAHLRGLVSRDYLHEFSTDIDETIFWKAFQQNGSLLQFANSFLIVAGRQNEQVESVATTEFVHVAGEHRKPEFRTVTRMPRNSTRVTKQHLCIEPTPGTAIEQICTDEEYLAGELLSEIWLSSLMIWHDMDRMNALTRQYFDYLSAYAANEDVVDDIYDILPFNVIVSQQGEYQAFDREWRLGHRVTPEFVLFRGLFWFAYGNIRHMAELFKKQGFDSIRAFIDASFRSIGLQLEDKIEAYIETEERTQQLIGRDTQDGLIRSLLDARPDSSSSKLTFHPRVYWANTGAQYSEDKSLKRIAALGINRQQIVFDIPADLQAGSRVRFDPADQEGYFHIYNFCLKTDIDANEQGRELIRFDSASSLAQSAKINGAVLHGSSSRAVFVASNDDPWFEVVLPEDAKGLRLVVEMDWPHSEEYEIVRAELQQMNNEWQWEKEKLVQEIETLKRDHDASGSLSSSSDQGILTKVLSRLRG